jgi:hypothetical protein
MSQQIVTLRSDGFNWICTSLSPLAYALFRLDTSNIENNTILDWVSVNNSFLNFSGSSSSKSFFVPYGSTFKITIAININASNNDQGLNLVMFTSSDNSNFTERTKRAQGSSTLGVTYFTYIYVFIFDSLFYNGASYVRFKAETSSAHLFEIGSEWSTIIFEQLR